MKVNSEMELNAEVNRREPLFLEKDEIGYICPDCNTGHLHPVSDTGEWQCDSCNLINHVATLYYSQNVGKINADALTAKLGELYGIEVENTLEKQEIALQEEIKTSVRDIQLRDWFRKYSGAGFLDNFTTGGDGRERLIKTGFNFFDDTTCNLYGGLGEGLYILGAVSSLGKTTFCFQLAEQIAKMGTPVLFFSLEQSRKELLSKGISRRTYQLAQRQSRKAVVAQRIANPILYRKLPDNQKALVEWAIEDAKKEDEKLFIFEGTQNGRRLGVEDIRRVVNSAYMAFHVAPVVFVDYLQILPPEKDMERATDKQITDVAVTKLKELSRNFHTPVFAISSFNRASYKDPVNMASFKESGAIEYSSDILLALQFKGMDNEKKKDSKGNWKYENDAERSKRIDDLMDSITQDKKNLAPVDIEVKCLKNRNGNTFRADMKLLHAFSCFYEPEADR